MKLVLDTRELTKEFFQDTRLLGIMSSVKDYQLCWLFNTMLGFDFRSNTDIEIQLTKKKRNYFFPVYEFCEPTGSVCHYLYNNQFDGEYLLPEFKHLDFLWLLKGDNITDESLQNITGTIKVIDKIQLVTELTNKNIKNKEHLIF